MAVVYTIHAGTHRARPLRFGLWHNKYRIRYRVTFIDCAYDLGGIDQLDTNKLFGIGYFPGHHKNSARFGWRYDYHSRLIIISAYCYDAGKRSIEDICVVPIGKPVVCDLMIGPKNYFFDVSDGDKILGQVFVNRSHRKHWSFPLGIYFGGNKDAPRTMNIQMQKL